MMIPHRFVQQFKCVGRMADVAVIKLVEQCDIVQTRHQIRLPARDGKRKDPLDLLRLGYDEQYAVHLLCHLAQHLLERTGIQIDDLDHPYFLMLDQVKAISHQRVIFIIKAQMFASL